MCIWLRLYILSGLFHWVPATSHVAAAQSQEVISFDTRLKRFCLVNSYWVAGVERSEPPERKLWGLISFDPSHPDLKLQLAEIPLVPAALRRVTSELSVLI
ncbi:hypothetical protein V22_11420 [Calycomorphotria hydatis]|uniref:Uncharacterized protein n=1 Tax=Calycomorphotria hydatis TaxID=2528027 RepID=A0A517T6B5_9PLAN|nr:hypothetical protein V22_11420 [Calycomorphotria hydatis]